jgi:hypothetical protein
MKSKTNLIIHVKGMSKTSFYRCWVNLRHRCNRPSHTLYKHYGARGITVCDAWMLFNNFYADMYENYAEGLQLDRIDNGKGYSKENCRWVTSKINCRNRRSNRMVNLPNGAITVAEASEKYGVRHATILYRLNHGYMPEQAVMKSIRGQNK